MRLSQSEEEEDELSCIVATVGVDKVNQELT